jgi:ferredoxin
MAQAPEIRLLKERCVFCGDCVRICPQSVDGGSSPALVIEGGEPRVENRDACIACFSCVEYCRASAIVISSNRSPRDRQPEVFPTRQRNRIL